MELLISKHARELLRTYRLRAFGRLAIALSFPMKKWLVKERYVASAHFILKYSLCMPSQKSIRACRRLGNGVCRSARTIPLAVAE